MTRKQHGNYDENKGLPDNRGQAVGDGLYVWFCSEVEQRYGRDLVAQAQAHGDRRYLWLIAQLEAMQDDAQATQLVEEFHVRRKASAADHRQQERYRRLAGWQRQLEEEQNEQRRTWLARQIEAVQRNIEKATKSE